MGNLCRMSKEALYVLIYPDVRRLTKWLVKSVLTSLVLHVIHRWLN